MSSHESFRRTKVFPSLDGLRCVSILAVIWFHTSGLNPGLKGSGFLGVELFFAISGFLITTLLVRESESAGRISLTAFYLRRTLRIFPLYYVVLAAYVLLTWRFEHGAAGEAFWRNLPSYLTYTSNWLVPLDSTRTIFYFAWSLATEEQFYLFWPVVLASSRSRGRAAGVMIVLLVAGQLVRSLSAHGLLTPHLLGWKILASVSPSICLGCLCALLVSRPAGFAAAAAVLGKPWSPIAAGALLLAAIEWVGPGLIVFALMAALVTSCCIAGRHWLAPALENPVVRHVGTVSYGMYLMHMLCFNALHRTPLRAASTAVLFLAATLLTVAVASAAYSMLERPLLAMKARLSARLLERNAEHRPPMLPILTAGHAAAGK